MPSATKEKHRKVGIGCHELEASGRDHRQFADFADDRGRRAVPHGVLNYRQQRSIIARMRVNHLGRGKASLSKAGRVKVSARTRP